MAVPRPHICRCLAENVNRILELGPDFLVMGKVDADFDLYNVVASVSIAYHLYEVAVTFRPQNWLNKSLL